MNDIDNINSLEVKLTDNLFCHVCGSRRKRNLIVSYTAKKKGVMRAVYAYLLNAEEEAYQAGHVDRHVICYRCSMLAISEDQKRYIPDQLFGSRKYRYKNRSQINATRHFKEIE